MIRTCRKVRCLSGPDRDFPGNEDPRNLPGQAGGAREEGDRLHGKGDLGDRGQVLAAYGIEDDDPAARPLFLLHNPPQGLLPGRHMGQVDRPDGQGGLVCQQFADMGFLYGGCRVPGRLRERQGFLSDHHDPPDQHPALLRVRGGQETEGKIRFLQDGVDLGTDVAPEGGIDLLVKDRELFGVEALQETGQNIEGLRRGKAAGDRVDDQDVLRRSGGKRERSPPRGRAPGGSSGPAWRTERPYRPRRSGHRR